MTTIDLLVKRLRDEKISREETLEILDKFKKELERNESGDLSYFKDTAIPSCFRYYYNAYNKHAGFPYKS
ncbi:MAG: hypothetical protein Q8N63_04415 [Nanoarchaeota archaeon]|nr:hypothetical protein [Nanoarchaeota archaeon]